MKYNITSKKHYHQTMVEVFGLMNKGETKLSKKELVNLEAMALAVEQYEDEVLGLKPGRSPVVVAVENKMKAPHLSQVKFASEAGIGKSRLSE
ncbi:MAG: transcriptional regulator, partial [Bacteroidota bacterium]|nr:transcriptional regulator [Bacteroidota bacterium]